MRHYQSKNPLGKTILFFSRDNCEYSKSGLDLMLELGFDVWNIVNKNKTDKLPDDISFIDFDYLICFRSWLIIPQWLIDKAQSDAINLHPGPPQYPGSGCINFALYEDAEQFGTTMHFMNAKVDSGTILDVQYFPITKTQTLESVLQITHHKVYGQLCDLIIGLAHEGRQYIIDKLDLWHGVQWSKTKRTLKQLNEHRIITADMSEEEINKRERAFHHKDFPIFLQHNNKTYVYSKDVIK